MSDFWSAERVDISIHYEAQCSHDAGWSDEVMQVNMVFSTERARANLSSGMFELEVVMGVGYPANIRHLTVFADIEIEPSEYSSRAKIYTRLIDPEGLEASRSESRERDVAINPFDAYGRIALLTVLPPHFPSRGMYSIELIFNDECVHSKRFQVGE